ncbi:Succinate--hydroxymethylglutarate CoA-transferase [Penicillium odoratum]|uniref:Succinate--hydroxymethylglutarate CoA-transferase n=1 Tax=Penicillium odoratum TaxID=1167516 RepID=UPI0025498D82|nr:Succinate--hydroxymethylglutarate CoA-transferase [Penicillium odoratum]KAJ5778197.1 Succinate--hydroxymethylglutarate CoA-transferase [Penicillium odoratum]
MAHIIPSPEIYGSGSFIDTNPLPVPDDASRIFKLLAKATPGFTQDFAKWETVSFEGSAEPIIPGPIKAPQIAAALHAMCGIVANEIINDREAEKESSHQRMVINTDHAALWLGTVGFVKLNGMDIPEMTKAGKLSAVYKTDFEKGAFAAPLRVRTTANYPTKTPGVWYQLHGSLNAIPVLKAIGLDPEMPCSTPQEAYDIISKCVQQFGADELEMKMVKLGLCGNIVYTPQGWRETEMSKQLSRHPLVNYKLQSHAISTPPVPMPHLASDKRPLAGIKVVELVRIIAGPVIGTTLAALGADVIRVNCSRLPDINSLQLTLNAGVRTIDIDLKKDQDVERLMSLVQKADIFIQGYRPGVIAKNGLSLPDLLEMAGKRGKGIVYVEENCYGPDGSFSARPGWQQVGDAASGASYVTARAIGHTDGRGILPSLPIPDMMTGLIGALGALMSIRDRARNGGSYHVFASLLAAAAYPLNPEIGLYSPDVVKRVDEKFKWESMDASLFVFELLDVAMRGWKRVFPDIYSRDSPFTVTLEGEWGTFDLLKPVVNLVDEEVTPRWLTAPVPHCWHDSATISWHSS